MAADVIDLRSRIARTLSPVRAAMAQLGASHDELAEILSARLGWLVKPGHVKAWDQDGIEPPDEVANMCQALATDAGSSCLAIESADEVASAVDEAVAEQSWFLQEPASQSIDSLWEALAGVARATNRGALEGFSASHRIRTLAVKLVDQARRPEALSDLYTIAGQATALMASTAFDLNRWDASATLAQSAVSYAALVGNSSLQAWTFGLAALLANWRNEPDIALGHFGRGLSVAPPGTSKARLRYIAARSYALLGDRPSVDRIIDQARSDQDDAERHGDLLCEETGGEFAFSRARADACAAAAWLDLGCGDEAKDAAQRALSELTAMHPSRQSVSQVTGARIDLAAACLLARDRDEAEEALGHVFAVPSPLRNVSLSGRLARTQKSLASAYWSADPKARQLNDALAEWLAGWPRPRPGTPGR
jgi:hypothetical protein